MRQGAKHTEIIMKKVISLLITLLLAFGMTFAFAGCGNKTEYSYWEIKAKQAADSRLTFVSELSFGSSYVEIGEVWLNVSDISGNGVDVTLQFYKSSTLKKTWTYRISSDALKKSESGWLNAYFDTAIECTKVVVSVIDSMKFNEICFINSDAKLASLTFTQGGVKSSTSDKSANIYDRATLDKLDENDIAYNKYPAYNIIDEQDKFPLEYIKTKA